MADPNQNLAQDATALAGNVAQATVDPVGAALAAPGTVSRTLGDINAEVDSGVSELQRKLYEARQAIINEAQANLQIAQNKYAASPEHQSRLNDFVLLGKFMDDLQKSADVAAAIREGFPGATDAEVQEMAAVMPALAVEIDRRTDELAMATAMAQALEANSAVLANANIVATKQAATGWGLGVGAAGAIVGGVAGAAGAVAVGGAVATGVGAVVGTGLLAGAAVVAAPIVVGVAIVGAVGAGGYFLGQHLGMWGAEQVGATRNQFQLNDLAEAMKASNGDPAKMRENLLQMGLEATVVDGLVSSFETFHEQAKISTRKQVETKVFAELYDGKGFTWQDVNGVEHTLTKNVGATIMRAGEHFIDRSRAASAPNDEEANRAAVESIIKNKMATLMGGDFTISYALAKKINNSMEWAKEGILDMNGIKVPPGVNKQELLNLIGAYAALDPQAAPPTGGWIQYAENIDKNIDGVASALAQHARGNIFSQIGDSIMGFIEGLFNGAGAANLANNIGQQVTQAVTPLVTGDATTRGQVQGAQQAAEQRDRQAEIEAALAGDPALQAQVQSAASGVQAQNNGGIAANSTARPAVEQANGVEMR